MEYSSKLQKLISENTASSEAYTKSLVNSESDFNYIYSQIILKRVIDMKLKELLFRIKDDDHLYIVAASNYTYIVNRNSFSYSSKVTAFYRISESILQEVIEGIEMIKEIKRMEKEQTVL